MDDLLNPKVIGICENYSTTDNSEWPVKKSKKALKIVRSILGKGSTSMASSKEHYVRKWISAWAFIAHAT